MITETSAGGIVYKKNDDKVLWLIVQHKKALHWGFPKGHIGDHVENELIEEAALREVSEEGGVQAKIISNTPINTTYFFKKGADLHKKTVHYFLMEYISGDTKNHDDEVAEAKFVETDEAWDTLTYNTDKEAFSKILKDMNT